MRKYGFRAYNPRDKKMHYDITGFEFLDSSNMSGVFIDGDFYLKEEVYIMQFTGLHDKNGKEIYEGDIVKVKNVNYHIGQIIYDEEYAEYEIEIGKDSEFPISVLYTLSYDLDIEVIGNIYENPELLKGADNIE